MFRKPLAVFCIQIFIYCKSFDNIYFQIQYVQTGCDIINNWIASRFFLQEFSDETEKK